MCVVAKVCAGEGDYEGVEGCGGFGATVRGGGIV